MSSAASHALCYQAAGSGCPARQPRPPRCSRGRRAVQVRRRCAIRPAVQPGQRRRPSRRPRRPCCSRRRRAVWQRRHSAPTTAPLARVPRCGTRPAVAAPLLARAGTRQCAAHFACLRSTQRRTKLRAQPADKTWRQRCGRPDQKSDRKAAVTQGGRRCAQVIMAWCMV